MKYWTISLYDGWAIEFFNPKIDHILVFEHKNNTKYDLKDLIIQNVKPQRDSSPINEIHIIPRCSIVVYLLEISANCRDVVLLFHVMEVDGTSPALKVPKTADRKVCVLSGITRSWFVERNIVVFFFFFYIWHFEHPKWGAVSLYCIQEEAGNCKVNIPNLANHTKTI